MYTPKVSINFHIKKNNYYQCIVKQVVDISFELLLFIININNNNILIYRVTFLCFWE